MPFRLLQFTMATLLFSLLSGCQSSADEVNILFQEENHVLKEESYELDHGLQFSFTQVSVLTQGGYEVFINHEQFSEKWNKLIRQENLSPIANAEPIYTVLAWDQASHPHVFHISENSFKMDNWYQSGEMTDFLAWLKAILGHNILHNLQMERMSVHASDIGTRTHVPQELAKRLITSMKQAKPIASEFPFVAALYPNYQLNIEYGDKGYFTVVVINAETFLLQDGRDQWIYRIEQPLFAELSLVNPITVYSQSHVKSLYQSDDVYIQLNDVYLYLTDVVDEVQLATQWMHHLTRMLSMGQLKHLDTIDSTNVESPWARLLFTSNNQGEREVELYEDYFMFEGNYYYVNGLSKKLQPAFQYIIENE